MRSLQKLSAAAAFALVAVAAHGALVDEIGNVFSSIFDLFSSKKRAPVELFDHIESMALTDRPESFMFFETDFYNDGNPYLWISHDKNAVGSGYFFNIYKKRGDHYELLDDYAVFTPELLAFYGENYSNVQPRLLTYSRINGQEGNLVVYKVDKKDRVFSTVYKTIEPMGADAELFEKLFPADNAFVQTVPTAEFPAFLAQRGIHSPKKSNIEFLAFDLGGKTGVVMLATNPEENVGASGWSAFNLHRKDTLLNDIGLRAIGIDFSLDSLIPFEIRNPGWKKLKIFPEGRKLIFFKNFSFIRKIDRRKFLITMSRSGADALSLSFYQLSFSRVCAFDIGGLKLDPSQEGVIPEDAEAAAAFVKALDFDYDKDGAYFQYKLYPAEDVVYHGNDITIPKDLDVGSSVYKVKEIKLPEGNPYTERFRAEWNAVLSAARAQQGAEDAALDAQTGAKKAPASAPAPTKRAPRFKPVLRHNVSVF